MMLGNGLDQIRSVDAIYFVRDAGYLGGIVTMADAIAVQSAAINQENE